MTVYFRNTGKRQKQLPRHKGRQEGWQYRPATANAFETLSPSKRTPRKDIPTKGHINAPSDSMSIPGKYGIA